jgi:DNA-binding transcriptional ArsR family regulator
MTADADAYAPVWSDLDAPGGWVCNICLTPVESEPCPEHATPDADVPAAAPATARVPVPRRWPLVLIAAPAAVAVWSGWVGLGTLCGFGIVHPLPGIVPAFQLNTAITLPVGVEAYGAYALGAWLTPAVPAAVRRFACRSALGALVLGMAGQVIYHLLAAAHAARAPWPVVVLVSCLPVVTLGFGAGLTHLLRAGSAAAPAGHPATGADISADTTAGIPPDTRPDAGADTTPDTRPARTRSPRRPGRPDTSAAIARLRDRHPDMTAAEIAARLGVSDRTVRRHLSRSAAPPAIAA